MCVVDQCSRRGYWFTIAGLESCFFLWQERKPQTPWLSGIFPGLTCVPMLCLQVWNFAGSFPEHGPHGAINVCLKWGAATSQSICMIIMRLKINGQPSS